MKKDSWIGILSSAFFALRSTYHMTLKAMPEQLAFGRNMIPNTKFIADWEAIRKQK